MIPVLALLQMSATLAEGLLADSLAKDIEQRYRVLDNPGLAAYLERVAERVAPGRARSIRVLDDGERLAIPLPGGRAYVSVAEIRSHASERDLAFTLAHLLAHSSMESLHPRGDSRIVFHVACRSSDPIPSGLSEQRREREAAADAEARRMTGAAEWPDSPEFRAVLASIQPEPRPKPSLRRRNR